MKSFLRRVHMYLHLLGLDPVRTLRTLRRLPRYYRQRMQLSKQQMAPKRYLAFGKAYPCLDDYSMTSGIAKGNYFHQDLLVARKIFENSPQVHLDVGSRIDGFVAHVAAYRTIRVLDIRPNTQTTPNIDFVQADLMEQPAADLLACCDSLSCLHALEHFGLGRYGDPVDFDGYLKGLNNLDKLLKPGGKFYLSVPLGPTRIEFNAHRVFSLKFLLDVIGDRYRIDTFSYVDDRGDLHENVGLTTQLIESNGGCQYGCAIFELTKL